MRRFHHFAHSTAALLVVISAVSLGFAEPVQKIQRASPETGYTYTFLDDPLDAGGLPANQVHLRVSTHVIRTTLIRPRTAFVTELLKTVENL